MEPSVRSPLPRLPLPNNPSSPTSSSAIDPPHLLGSQAQASNPLPDANERMACNGCKNILEDAASAGDSVVVSFGSSLWHVDCFRCAKCRNLVEHDTNLLLLSDGSPVCENCSYICSVCKTPISNEAIVTGDESYHADCFRCRSCSNRIEELIFAKTSQGIYCMTCHNERVTRSRRHAEAKRNKSANPSKKDRDPRSSDKNHRLKQPSSAAPTSSTHPPLSSHDSTTYASKDSPSHHSLHHKASSPRQPSVPALPASPSQNSQAPPKGLRRTSLSILGLNAQKQRSPNAAHSSHDPSTRERSRAPHTPASYTTPPSPPLKDSPGFPTPSSAARLPHTTSHTASNNRPHTATTSSERQPLHVPLPKPLNIPSTHLQQQVPSGLSPTFARPATADGSSSPGGSPVRPAFRPLNRSFESSPHMLGPSAKEEDENLSTTRPSEPDHLRSSWGMSRPTAAGGLSVDKAANRRSKIVPVHNTLTLLSRNGSNELTDPSTIDGVYSPRSEVQGRTSLESLSEQSHLLHPAAPNTSSPTKRPLLEARSSTERPRFQASSSSERPLSYYDPEVLFFLDSHTSETAGDVPIDTRAPDSRESTPEMELLASEPTEEQEGRRRRPKDEMDEMTRRVRASMNLSSNAGDMSLDVGLVEQLLSSLQSTKERMKELQDQYNAIKRASRSAFEGFSLAREEYDREAAARKQAESKMRELKAQMLEQASRLTDIKSLQSLEQESQQLRNSVTGLQKHLSQLTIERDLRVAEFEALKDVPVSAEPAQSVVESSLSAKLDALRQDYKTHIDELVLERDRLKEEIGHLAHVRSSHIKELESLNQRQDLLADLNTTAMRQLEETRASLVRLATPSGPQSVISRTLTAPPPAPSPSSSQLSHNDGGLVNVEEHSPLPTDVTIATTRKFKWGKTQKAVVSQAKPTHKSNGSVSTSETVGASANNTGLTPGASLAAAANAAVGVAGTSGQSNGNGHMRPHNFQPVSALRPVRCDYCGDKLWGLAEVRCTVCGSYSHSKCAPNFFGCQNFANGSGLGGDESVETVEACIFGNDLVMQAKLENNLVPHVVVKCIEAVEQNGLKFEGIYRKTGGMSSVKAVQASFEKGLNVDLNDLNKFNDISAVTSALKNYFRQLPNPLLTFELHEAFVTVAAMPQENIRLEALERVVYQLPQVHFETLRVLMRHLNRIQRLSESNKMTAQNLGVVFGPTLLRSSNPTRQFSDMPHTAKVVELMVDQAQTIFRKAYCLPSPGLNSFSTPAASNDRGSGSVE